VAALTEAVAPLFAGRKLVVTGGPLAAMTGTCRRLLELGAQRPFLVATGVGTGEVPGPDEAEWVVVQLRAPDIIAEIAGRRVYGPRRPEWRRLEDKVVVDALWDDLGVPRAPSAVVPAQAAALRAAAARLDRGAGTAWAGDASQGFNGGPTACAGSGLNRMRPRRPPSWPSAATKPG